MVEVLLITGSTRSGSTNTAALRTMRDAAPEGVEAVLHEGLADLPAFNPDDDVDPLPPAVAELRSRLAAADAVLFCTPEYAGTLPGSFKNLLDWSVGGTELNGKPTAWVNVAAEGRGDGAISTLETVLRYLSVDLVEPACARLFVPRDAVGADGAVSEPGIRDGLREVLRALAARV
ncbi:NADPH-dependent FMN reductase [Saccharopolyspora sp. NPDC000359]|uniref:NADPH-dependent FMN reductase n=1 Tax=Saccharopolyspora sp. NPDC000359 TaxID=3154251 RepID=UPI0033309A21